MSPPVSKALDPSYLETQAFDVMDVDLGSGPQLLEDRRQAAKAKGLRNHVYSMLGRGFH